MGIDHFAVGRLLAIPLTTMTLLLAGQYVNSFTLDPDQEREFLEDMFIFFLSSFIGFTASVAFDFGLPTIPAWLTLFVNSVIGVGLTVYLANDAISLGAFGLGLLFNGLGAIASLFGKPGLLIAIVVNSFLAIYSIVWMILFGIRLLAM